MSWSKEFYACDIVHLQQTKIQNTSHRQFNIDYGFLNLFSSNADG